MCYFAVTPTATDEETGELVWSAACHAPPGHCPLELRIVSYLAIRNCIRKWMCRVARTSSVSWDTWCDNDPVAAWRYCFTALPGKRVLIDTQRAGMSHIIEGGRWGKEWVVGGPGDGSVEKEQGKVDLNNRKVRCCAAVCVFVARVSVA